MTKVPRRNVGVKCKDRRDTELDFALISCFSGLNSSIFLRNKNSNPTIQSKLGELIGYRVVAGFKVDDLAEGIIKQQIGSKDYLRSLAFVFETQRPKLITEKKHRKVLKYYSQLLSPQNEFEVVEKASYLFERPELKPKDLHIIIKHNLHEELFKNINNIPAQLHFINYLNRCILNHKFIPEFVSLLYKQMKSVDDLFSDRIIVERIAEIITKVL